MSGTVLKARCLHCRADVEVPASYADGDHVRCGTCGTQHKVQRGDVLRLVLADIAPLRDSHRENQQRIGILQADLRQARGSFGIGANGLGIGVIYVVWQVALKEQPISQHLFMEALGIAIASGVLLELANWLFLAKRQTISRLQEEIRQTEAENRLLQQRIREASRR
jgi:hypothetical protein